MRRIPFLGALLVVGIAAQALAADISTDRKKIQRALDKRFCLCAEADFPRAVGRVLATDEVCGPGGTALCEEVVCAVSSYDFMGARMPYHPCTNFTIP